MTAKRRDSSRDDVRLLDGAEERAQERLQLSIAGSGWMRVVGTVVAFMLSGGAGTAVGRYSSKDEIAALQRALEDERKANRDAIEAIRMEVQAAASKEAVDHVLFGTMMLRMLDCVAQPNRCPRDEVQATAAAWRLRNSGAGVAP